MDLTRDPQTIAHAAAEEVRALNHSTLAPDAFATPSDVSSAADGIATLLQRLPQTLDQIGAALSRFEGKQAIRMDDGTNVGEQVALVLQAVQTAQAGLGMAESAFRGAAGPLSHMGGHFPPEGDEVVDVSV